MKQIKNKATPTSGPPTKQNPTASKAKERELGGHV